MIDDVAKALREAGVEEDRIRFERFTPSGEAPRPRKISHQVETAVSKGVPVEVVLDGVRRTFPVTGPAQTVLDAAQAAGIKLPYSCAGGMCCTCRCRVVEGRTEMAVNFSLQPWEIEAGFTLACQTRPLSEKLVLDFDAA
jgi:ring-1,2-phenylacetyl-CoA epoxidase subunit PaaE